MAQKKALVSDAKTINQAFPEIKIKEGYTFTAYDCVYTIKCWTKCDEEAACLVQDPVAKATFMQIYKFSEIREILETAHII